MVHDKLLRISLQQTIHIRKLDLQANLVLKCDLGEHDKFSAYDAPFVQFISNF